MGKEKIVFIGDNRDRVNWGCRATSKALLDMTEMQDEIIFRVLGNKTLNFIPHSLSNKLGLIIYKRFARLSKKNRIFGYILKLLNLDDFISSNLNETLNNFHKRKLKDPFLFELDSKIKECDKLIVNGEGTFIFSTPPRRDTIYYLLVLKIAQQYGKETYCLNGMFSNCPDSEPNNGIIEETINVFENCTKVTLRDLISYRYLNQLSQNVNCEYVPDALFTWSAIQNKYAKFLVHPETICPFPEIVTALEKIDFTKPYICISGSSSIKKRKSSAIKSYSLLVNNIKELGFNVIIVPTCGGDSFLEQVSRDTQSPLVPVNVNIYLGMALLSNALVLVSGRWHPSILASVGGTPCVMFSSNSHKSKSLLELLEYEDLTVFNDIPSDEQIVNIISKIKHYEKQGESLREKILIRSRNLGLQAYNHVKE